MKTLALMLGAATLAIAGPAVAKPGNQGGGHGKAHATMKHGAKSQGKGMTKHVHQARYASLRDRDRDGIDDRDEALARRYGGALCAPGLAKKSPACVPPGQAKRLFRDGQRVPTNYRYYTPYGSIPDVLIDRYDLDDDYRYIYRNNVIYQVDPRTSLITRIIDAIL